MYWDSLIQYILTICKYTFWHRSLLRTIDCTVKTGLQYIAHCSWVLCMCVVRTIWQQNVGRSYRREETGIYNCRHNKTTGVNWKTHYFSQLHLTHCIQHRTGSSLYKAVYTWQSRTELCKVYSVQCTVYTVHCTHDSLGLNCKCWPHLWCSVILARAFICFLLI